MGADLMYALIRKSDNALTEMVDSLDGCDLEAHDAVEFTGDPLKAEFAAGRVRERGPNSDEQSRAALLEDELWERLADATPEQMEAWLQSNVTSIASARRVLKFVLLALKSLRRGI